MCNEEVILLEMESDISIRKTSSVFQKLKNVNAAMVMFPEQSLEPKNEHVRRPRE